MIAVIRTAPVTTPIPAEPAPEQPAPIATPAPEAGGLRGEFERLATDLESTDAQLTQMVAQRSRVGTGWGPHLTQLAGRIQTARDAFVAARPNDPLVARLGTDVLKLAEAGGNLKFLGMAQQTLTPPWADFLDNAVATARAAAQALAGGTPLPKPTPTPGPTPTPTPEPTQVQLDARRAAGLVQQSIAKIQQVPASDHGDASTKDLRIAAFNLNKQAQEVLERHFGAADEALVSQLRTADASLEDAAWQLAKKPSPDGRFNGVDIPGALRDSRAAYDLLMQLGAAAGDA